MFSELATFLTHDKGRVGLVLPSGIWTDHGGQDLRKTWLLDASWEWCYGFENKRKIFPIHSMFKFATVIVDKGGRTESVRTAFMRHDVADWEQPTPPSAEVRVDAIRRFSPEILSLLELRGDRDLYLTDRIYADHPLLDQVVGSYGGQYSREFNTTSDSRKFTSRRNLERDGIVEPGLDLRDPRARAKLRLAGYELLYEGKSIWLHDPYFLGRRTRASISKAVDHRVAEESLEGSPYDYPRIAFRHIASSTNQRTLCVAVIPPSVHADSASTLAGRRVPLSLAAVLGSLVLDYVTRMKVTTNMNWFHVGTLPVAVDLLDDGGSLELMVRQLNMLGSEFGDGATAVVGARSRMAERLVLDATVADGYALSLDDMTHIASRFPIYDKHAGDHAYPRLAVQVYSAFCQEGPKAAAEQAQALTRARADAGWDFGLDEVYVPEGGWDKANAEARRILEAG